MPVVLGALIIGGAPAVHAASAADQEPGLLFRYSADHGLAADFARGESQPNFADKVKVIAAGRVGPGLQAAGDEVLSWQAGANIFAQRGTLSFFWRARDPIGQNPFPLFRVGYADHTSWDMMWLRMDWNGHGIDAFVTDNNLARVRVSYTIPEVPRPDQWTHLALSWDETTGIRLYVNGMLAARKDAVAVLDSGLDQFGPHSRTISPHQVQSAYSYLRGGDLDEIRVYDHALDDASVAVLAKNEAANAGSAPPRDLTAARWRNEWWLRYGWNRANDPPPYLADAATRIRKVEFTDARDLKERMNGANDGIAETTWPGVYNRSRLPGRHDYYELPDWNVYVEGGKSITFTLPQEPWNRLEVQGAAYGHLTFLPTTGPERKLAERAKGQERTYNSFAALEGGRLRFDNVEQETPIQELAAYYVTAGSEPADEQSLSYIVRTGSDPSEYPTVDELTTFIDGRYAPDERVTVVALPNGVPSKPRAEASSGLTLPIVHVLIPDDFRLARSGQTVGHASYGWENLNAGLDGIAIDLPALHVEPTHGGLFPLNIQVKDPLWPARNMLDVSVSVKPDEPRTVWLDTRDRMLPPGHSLYLTVAGAGQDFNAKQLDGAKIRLRFKPRAQALPEHIADRFAQMRDNMAFLVEEHTNTKRLARYDRLDRDLTDLLRVDPENIHAREYWVEMNPEQGWPDKSLPTVPAGVPRWAILQVEDLRRVRHYINWWIDERQVPYGDFGGGISDDNDMTQQWPPLALMGVDPDKVRKSLDALDDAAERNGMWTNGLGTIKTDELHSYEEALNAKAEAMYLSYGDPKTVERLMETARNYGRIIQKTEKGHTHILSNYFSGTDTVREGIWGWSKPYSNLILHPGVALADFNGNPTVRKLVIDLADGYLAHGHQDADGGWTFPEEINASTEETRGVLTAKSRGNVALMQILWEAYSWTHDERYLRPLQSELAGGTAYGELSELNANLLDILNQRSTWGAPLQAAAEQGKGGDFARLIAWQMSGDTRHLEKIYGDEIITANNRMYMVTEGHWWSDRVELFTDELQRSRLGGMALRRNQFVPGHVVSWRFADPDGAQKLAILVPGALPTKFKVIAYNLDSKPLLATMTGWGVAPGVWKVSQRVLGADTAGSSAAATGTVGGAGSPAAGGPGGAVGGVSAAASAGGTAASSGGASGTPSAGGAAGGEARHVQFERSSGLDFAFAPHVTTELDLELETPGQAMWGRPDVGIGAVDVHVAKGSVRVTVHSLGSVAAPPSTVTLVDASGRVLASTKVPAIPAPLDLLPKTASVTLHFGTAVRTAGTKVRVQLADGVREITQLNNEVVVQ
jgi:hypothetical protein